MFLVHTFNGKTKNACMYHSFFLKKIHIEKERDLYSLSFSII